MATNRIDFVILNNKVVINKFERRDGRDVLTRNKMVEDFDLEEALQLVSYVLKP